MNWVTMVTVLLQLNNSMDSTAAPNSHPKKKKRPRESAEGVITVLIINLNVIKVALSFQ